MRNILYGIVGCLVTAASVVILIQHLSANRVSLNDLEDRLAGIEQKLGPTTEVLNKEEKRERPSVSEAMRQTESPDKLSEIITLLTEIEGMILDSERTIRSDLTRITTSLLKRLDALEGKIEAGDGTSQAAAKEELRSRLASMGVKVIEQEGMVEIEGEILQPSRVIEFAAVAAGGSAHESLALLNVTPSALKIALEDIGMQETNPDERGGFPPEAKGCYVYVLWEGIKKPRRMEDLILNKATKSTMERGPWMFTASFFQIDKRTWTQQFSADFHNNIIAIAAKFSEGAILACPLEDAQNENIWEPHPDLCPPAGTKIRLFVRTEKNEQWDKI